MNYISDDLPVNNKLKCSNSHYDLTYICHLCQQKNAEILGARRIWMQLKQHQALIPYKNLCAPSVFIVVQLIETNHGLDFG